MSDLGPIDSGNTPGSSGNIARDDDEDTSTRKVDAVSRQVIGKPRLSPPVSLSSNLVAEWDRAILKASLRDCPPAEDSLREARKMTPDSTTEALAVSGELLFKLSASSSQPHPTSDLGVDKGLESHGLPNNHRVRALFSTTIGKQLNVEFHAAEINSETLNRFLPSDKPELSDEDIQAFLSQEKPEIELDEKVNCSAFATGFRASKGVLEPGALPGQRTPSGMGSR